MNLATEKQPLASEIIADQQKEIEKLKTELKEARQDAKDWEESWNMSTDKRLTLMTQSNIISLVLKINNYKNLELVQRFARIAYTQQLKEEQENKKNEALSFNSAAL